MERVLRWLQMLGTTGALANARALSDERHTEDDIVERLMGRLGISDAPSAAA
jgi:hypothetical protein